MKLEKLRLLAKRRRHLFVAYTRLFRPRVYLILFICFLLRQVNSLAASPFRLQQIAKQMIRTGTRLPSVKNIKMGGTPMTQALVDGVLSAFSCLECLRNVYGMAESCGVVCCPAVNDVGNTSLGYPAPMTEIKVCHSQAYFLNPARS